MGWTAGNKTGEEKSEITLCIGSEVPEHTWRVGRDVGLQRCSPGLCYQAPLCPIHRAPTTKAANTYTPAAVNEATHYPAAFQQRWG